MKAARRVAHAELVSRIFMIRLKGRSIDAQQLIMNALYRHFDPWRIVRKEDSITTPIRLVVDNKYCVKSILKQFKWILILFACN